MFFLFGAWWTVQVLCRYFQCRQAGKRFRTTATYPCFFCPGQRMRELPMEAIVKISLSGVGIIVEFIGGINSQTHRFDSVGNAQHITMYSFFLISGVLDILTLRGLAPPGADYFGVVIALLVEGALFKFHLFERTELDILLHTLLLYVIAFSVIVVILEHFNRSMAILPLLRALLTMVQGTWFWAVGIILYNPTNGAQPWDPNDHQSHMLAVVCFSWHVACNLVLMFIVGGVASCCYRGAGSVKYSSLPMKSLGGGEDEETTPLDAEMGNGKAKVYRDALDNSRHSDDNDNSDIEFQVPVRQGQ